MSIVESPPRINRGAWYGSQIGGTAYLLTGAAVLLGLKSWLWLIWLGCFLGATAAGAWPYRRSGRSTQLGAFTRPLALCAVAGAIAIGTTYPFATDAWRAMR